ARAGDNVIHNGITPLAYRLSKGNWIYNHHQANVYYSELASYSISIKVDFSNDPEKFRLIGDLLIFQSNADYFFEAPETIKMKGNFNDKTMLVLRRENKMDSASMFTPTFQLPLNDR
ncbi:MAG: hypothetical protein ACRC3B_09955, partial [Bacteroidia bacterium]